MGAPSILISPFSRSTRVTRGPRVCVQDSKLHLGNIIIEIARDLRASHAIVVSGRYV